MTTGCEAICYSILAGVTAVFAALMNGLQDFILLCCADPQRFQGFPCATIGANQSSVIQPGKGRMLGEALPALGADCRVGVLLFHIHFSSVL